MPEPVLIWNGEDCRAFVPPAALEGSTSVVRSTPADLLQSPGPFSVGVYVCDDGDATAFRPLSLFYVSQHVADDRAKRAPPLPSGWYLPVSKEQLGKRFEVRLTTCKEILASVGKNEMEGFDRARVSLSVGGKSTLRAQSFDFSTEGSGNAFFRTDKRWRGQCHRSAKTSGSSGKELISAFTFGQPVVGEDSAGEEGEPRNDIGVLEIETMKARFGPFLSKEGPSSSSKPNSEVIVSEKDVMKNGMGVRLAGDGKLIVAVRSGSRGTSRNKSRMPSLGLKIYVRDMSWMVRRHIVDAEGRAWREAAPRGKAAKAKKPLARAAAGSSSDKPLKKEKKDPNVVIESIDLTNE